MLWCTVFCVYNNKQQKMCSSKKYRSRAAVSAIPYPLLYFVPCIIKTKMRKRKKGMISIDDTPFSNSKTKKQKDSSARGTTSTQVLKKLRAKQREYEKKQAEMDEAETRLLLDPYKKNGSVLQSK